MASRNVPKNKEDLLATLPDKAIVTRLMNRYFNSNSPSQRKSSLLCTYIVAHAYMKTLFTFLHS